MYKIILTVFIGLNLSYSVSYGANAKFDCINFAYKKEVELRKQSGESGDYHRRALNSAADICKLEVFGQCLKFSYEYLTQNINPRNINLLRRKWGETVSACRPKVYENCLRFALSFWQKQNKPNPFQNAATSCAREVPGDCLEYVYAHERNNGHSEISSFNAGVNVCRTGVYKVCIQGVYEQLVPDAYPHSSDPWGDAIGICRKKL